MCLKGSMLYSVGTKVCRNMNLFTSLYEDTLHALSHLIHITLQLGGFYYSHIKDYKWHLEWLNKCPRLDSY